MKVKKNKKEKDIDKTLVEGKETKKKKKKDKTAIVIIIISTIFIILGIILALIGGGVINITFTRKPVLYLLSEKVKVGDYVNYDAGVWEETVAVPNRSKAYTFGGYTEKTSRNNSVTCDYNNVKSSGWRVFSIDDGQVTLIQNGISMCYYHGYGSATNEKSLKILTGADENINFDYYLDNKFGESVKILSKEDLDKYYNDDTSYKKIDDTIVNVGNPYWLATKNGSYYLWYVSESGMVAVDHVGEYGVRILVTLKKDVKTDGQNEKNIWQLTEEIKNEN